MCRGLPASGKSTWAAAQKGVVIVDSDNIRNESFGGYSEEYEDFVQVEKYSRIRRALEANKTVISTDPNLLPRHERVLRTLASRLKAEFEIKEFDTPLDECIARDAKRVKQVGRETIEYWNKKWKR